TLAYSFILSLFELLTKQNYYHAIVEVPTIIPILFLCSIFLFLSFEIYSLLHVSEDCLTYLLSGTPALVPTVLIILLLVKKLSFFYVLMYSKHNYTVSLTIFIALVLELFFSYYFLSLIKKAYHFSIYKYKQKILTMQYELELSNYHQLEHHQLNLRKIAHDLHNHHIILRDLINQNNPEQALSYLDEYANHIPAIQSSQLTGHKILNALLVKKQQQCLQHKIEFSPQIKLSPQLHLSDFDLCILIGNLLDNAIEATVKSSSESLRIEMYAKVINDNLIFQIINPYTGHLIKKHGGFSTSKINKLNHGLGLLNVDYVVKKYDGMIDFSYDEETFSATLRFPISHHN
ncbi:MAG: sensor histidine kinase, partial [Turicibacter sp.]